MGSKGGSKKQTVTQETKIPAFLQPIIKESANIGLEATRNLRSRLTNAGAETLVEPFTRDQVNALNMARATAGGAGGFIPIAQNQALQTAMGVGGLPLGAEGLAQLRGTAGGAGFNTPAFQNAFDAALRRSEPAVKGAFSLSGRTGSGLQKVAQTQAAADAFADLFNDERKRQIVAGSSLAGLNDAERQRQLAMSQALPQLGFLPSDALSSIGSQIQSLRQRQLLAPIQAQEMLASVAGGNVPIASLLGSVGTQPGPSRNVGAGILGGAATGLGIGAMMAPAGATGLAALGGPVGIGLALGGGLLGGLL